MGLLGRPSIEWGEGLWLVPCRAVHSIGMRFPIDLVFVGLDENVIHLQESLRPFHFSKICLDARSVLEVPSHTTSLTGTKIGDKLEFLPANR